MQETIRLSTTALDRIKQLNALGDYPQAYQVIIDETDGTGYSGRKWFTSAAGVNQGKGYTSAFIRTYTQLAKLLKNEKCHTFSDQELKTASDEIAVAVLTWVINREGLLPSFETIMEIDSGTAIMSLKITPIQWAGTPVSPPRYLLRDRDSIYGETVRRRIKSLGIEDVATAPRSPWQNPYVERVIGSIRRECLNHVIVINDRHLRRILRGYLKYYHTGRTHLS